jgi:hypothetical protein
MTVEVRAAGLLLPVAWESGGIPSSCGNCSVPLTLLSPSAAAAAAGFVVTV